MNATQGYRYNGAAPTGHILCGNGTNYVDSAASSCIGSVTLYYQTMQLNGASRTQRPTLNFDGSFFTVTDNGGSNRTDISLNSTLPVSITGNANTANSANLASAFDHTPAQCSGSTPLSTGNQANGDANCTPIPGNSPSTAGNISGSRAFGVTYQNTGSTFLDLYVTENQISGVGNNSLLTCYMGQFSAAYSMSNTGVTNSGGKTGCYLHVPPGWYYMSNYAITGGTPTILLDQWYEVQ